MSIADTNDEYRKKFSQENWQIISGIRIIFTSGVLAGNQSTDDILAAVASSNDFNGEADPDNEHVFGRINVNGVDIIWKLDYLAGDFLFPSPDKTNINKTIRVFTVMLSEEYQAAS